MDDHIGGEATPVSFVDDCNIAIHVVDLLFFMSEFERLGPPRGLRFNTTKTRIMTSTTGASAIPAIARHYGPSIAAEVNFCISKYSTKLVPDPSCPQGPKISVPHEETEGLRILGQPVGSYTLFAKRFFQSAFETAKSDATKLPTIFDKHSSLRLFQKCTMHKVPHLLASEVAYAPTMTSNWDCWDGPLANNINDLASSFLASLVDLPSLPLHSMLLAYVPIGQRHPCRP